MAQLKLLDENCHICGSQLNSWDARCSKSLGYHKKHCEKCIALEYDKTSDELREIMQDYFGMLPCRGI